MRIRDIVFVVSACGFSFAQAEICAVLCDGHPEHQLKTKVRKDVESSGLPTTKPNADTNFNCFKPVFVCLKNTKCKNENMKISWKPSKSSQLPLKEFTLVCEASNNLGNFIKADLETSLFHGEGSFVVKDKIETSYYYNAVTGE